MNTEVTEYKRVVDNLKLRKMALQAELRALEAAIGGIEQVVRISAEAGRGNAQVLSLNGLKPQDAVLAYLRAQEKRIKVNQIVEGISNAGVKTESGKPYALVYTCLLRLKGKGLAEKYDDGSWKAT